MTIKKFNYKMICDVAGCNGFVDEEISINGMTPDLRLCGKCMKTLYKGLSERYGGGKKNAK